MTADACQQKQRFPDSSIQIPSPFASIASPQGGRPSDVRGRQETRAKERRMSSVSGVNAAQASLIEQLKAQQAKPGQQGWNVQMDSVLQSLGVDSAKIPAIEKQMHDAAESARKGGGHSPALSKRG